MSSKYRIRKVVSDNGDLYYPEVKNGFGWKSVYLQVIGAEEDTAHLYPRRMLVSYDGFISGMPLWKAKLCIDYLVSQDNEKEEIIEYP